MKIILVDTSQPVINAWRHHFKNCPEVEIHHGSIFNTDCNTIVSPANSFGFMDDGLLPPSGYP